MILTLTKIKLGFTNICEIDDIRTAYPLLDMVDKGRRYETLTVSMMVNRKNKKTGWHNKTSSSMQY